MIKIKIIFFFFCTAAGIRSISAQTIKLLTEGTKTSLRGLSVVSNRVIWVSGSNGTVGQSLDSGNTWKWMTVKGYEKPSSGILKHLMRKQL